MKKIPSIARLKKYTGFFVWRLFTILLSFDCDNLLAQSNQENPCNTITPSVDFLEQLGPAKNPPITNATLKVFIHIIRKTNGGGNKQATIFEAVNAFNLMRSHYQPHTICFVLEGWEYIDDTHFYNFNPDKDFDDLVILNNHVDAIDIYCLPHKNFGGWNGRASSIPGGAFAVSGDALVGGTTPTHEMGHCLGLYHTHETYFGSEVVIRAWNPTKPCPPNCGVGGDKLCDTPADPMLDTRNGGNVNSSCQYTGITIDCNGDSYAPDVGNFLSYSWGCRNHFSAEQVNRMLDAIANAPILQFSIVPANVTVQNLTIPFDPLGPPPPVFSRTFTAKNTLTAGPNVNVNSGGTLNLVAENKVILLPGFKAELGSHFCAQIGPSCFPIPNCRIVPLDNNSNNNTISSDSFVLDATPVFDSGKDNELEKTISFSSNNIIPNPSNGNFNIEITNFAEIKSAIIVEIHNTLGEKVYAEFISASHKTIDLSSQPNGIYFIQLKTKQGITTKKLIIQK